MNPTSPSFPLDGASLYFMAQATKHHTNVYRFTVTLRDTVCPQALQAAVDAIAPRFPTILGRFCPGAFDYTMSPAPQPAQIAPDPGLLLTMSSQELETCAYRIYYQENQISLEAFHALTDGYGAITCMRALLGAYLHLRYHVSTPEREALLLTEPDWTAEWEDAYPQYSGGAAASLPQRYAYHIPGGTVTEPIAAGSLQVSTLQLRRAAKCTGVSVTTLLATLLAEAIMELQQSKGKPRLPVRIMVPVDLRRQFPSKSLRNFVLYALPTLEPGDLALPIKHRALDFQDQLQQQLATPFLAGQITRNQRIQESPLFCCLPISWKIGLMRLSNRIFGETNSSITLTNLGQLSLSDVMASYVRSVNVCLTPRQTSPYNCGLITLGDTTVITISRFGDHTALESRFFQKIQTLLEQEAPAG